MQPATWDRAVELPGGVRVLGRGVRRSAPPDPEPEFGLYLGVDAGATWPHRVVDWPDMRLPRDTGDAVDAIEEVWRRASDGQRVEVACLGGRGRTGTVLACLAIRAGVAPAEAVRWAREHHDRHAVETPWQRWWVRRYGRLARSPL